MSIFKALSEVAKDLKAVEMANMQRYKARHIYDVYNMIQPLLAKHGILVGRELVKEEESKITNKNGNTGTHRYQLWSFKFYKDGSDQVFETQFPAESIDWGDKAASQCDAMAFKQMFIHTFQIPTKDMQEPEDKPVMDHKKPEPFKNQPPKQKTNRTKKELEYLLDVMKQKELTKDQVQAFSNKMLKGDVNELDQKDFDTLISLLKDSTKDAILNA